MRVEITLTFEELPNGDAKENISGVEFGATSGGMEKMETLDPHACMAYCLAFVHGFHSQVSRRQQEAKGPKIQVARATGRG